MTGPGVGFGTAELPFATMGGAPVAGSITSDPNATRLAWLPRQAQIGLTPANTSVSAGSPGVIYDGGLFLSAPSLNLLLPANLAAPSTVASVAAVMGSRFDKADIQAAP